MDFDLRRLQRAREENLADAIEIGFLLLLAAVLFLGTYTWAAEPDAGVTDAGVAAVVIDVERAELVQANDAGVVLVTGGAWLSDPQLLLTAGELRACRSNPAPAPALPATPAATVLAVGVTSLVAALGGVAFGCWAGTGNVFCYVPQK